MIWYYIFPGREGEKLMDYEYLFLMSEILRDPEVINAMEDEEAEEQEKKGL